IERLRSIARLYGIFMLPSQGTLDLDYKDRLHTVQIVDEAALNKSDERAKVALDIIEDAAADAPRNGPSNTGQKAQDADDPNDPFPGRSSWV
ncbi:MAG: hypothetical protein JRH11_05030, partial [Deltaproteobacteria bacterium]|nr:hypothetical protein [Deltaproteobacteria bacterium]